MSEALALLERGKGEQIDLADLMCPICLSILIEPVSMPCRHVLCMPCFQENVSQASLHCPICRFRISVWCRQATKTNTLVCEKLWRFVQDKFSAHVASRQAGIDDTDPDEMFPCVPNHQFANQGDIRSEFEASLAKEREETERRMREEERQSRLLASRLAIEEQESWNRTLTQRNNQTLQDEQLAEQLFNTPSPGKENVATRKRRQTGPLDAFITNTQGSNSNSPVPPGSSPVPPAARLRDDAQPTLIRQRNQSAESNNSIEGEFRHFRPILSAPRSPPKRLADSSVRQPQVVKTSAKHLFSSGNMAQFVRKHDLAAPRTAKTASQTIDATETQSQSLLASNHEVGAIAEQKRPALVPSEMQEADLASADTQTLIEMLDSGVEEGVLEEQKRIERLLEQEKRDQELARALQSELDKAARSVDRTKGSADEYKLRTGTSASYTSSSTKAKMPLGTSPGSCISSDKARGSSTPTGAAKKARQMSLLESFKKTTGTAQK